MVSKVWKTGSPGESGTPEPPEISPLGGSPIRSPKGSGGGDPEQKRDQTVEGIFGDAADISSS